MPTAPIKTLIVCWLAAGLFLTEPASAQTAHWHSENNHWKIHWQHRNFNDEVEYDHRADGCYFEPRDVWMVSDYVQRRNRLVQPGIAKAYYKTGPLPAGWKRQIEALPVSLEQRMPVLPEGQRRAVGGGSLIVYDQDAGVIVDTIVLFGR